MIWPTFAPPRLARSDQAALAAPRRQRRPLRRPAEARAVGSVSPRNQVLSTVGLGAESAVEAPGYWEGARFPQALRSLYGGRTTFAGLSDIGDRRLKRGSKALGDRVDLAPLDDER